MPKENKMRGEAFKGKSYGTQRYYLQIEANKRIIESINMKFYCEAIAICESIISDRLESRYAFLSQKEGFGFCTLGELTKKLSSCESDPNIKSTIKEIDSWRIKRNEALHELVKVQAEISPLTWDDRMNQLSTTALDGYILLSKIYHQVADLNPKHYDRVFPRPEEISIQFNTSR